MDYASAFRAPAPPTRANPKGEPPHGCRILHLEVELHPLKRDLWLGSAISPKLSRVSTDPVEIRIRMRWVMVEEKKLSGFG